MMDQTMNKMQSSQSGFVYNANGLLVQKKKKDKTLKKHEI